MEIICGDCHTSSFNILDDESSEIIKKHLENKHIKFCLGRRIRALKADTAILDDNSEIEFDVLIMAAGVRPNISLIKDIGGKTNKGIIIDERCRTSIPDIYAAGDCCESIDISSGEWKLMALLPNAYMQGECAGMNMSGADCVFDRAVPMNSIGLLGMHIMTAGTYSGQAYYESSGKNYKKLFYSNNRLNGFILIEMLKKQAYILRL